SACAWCLLCPFHGRVPIVPTGGAADARAAAVLLTPSMALPSLDSRALVAGVTGRVARAIATRLERDGWRVVAAGRAQGDLRTRDGAQALAGHALSELGGLDLVVHAA